MKKRPVKPSDPLPFSRPLDTVVILGKGRSRPQAQIAIERCEAIGARWELWTLNDLHHPAATAHFEIHSPRHHPTEHLTIPVYIDPAERPGSRFEIPYPLHLVELAFPLPPWRSALTCAIPYMLALAILAGPRRIALPGVDMNGIARERWQEIPGIAFFIGAMDARKIEWALGETSEVLSGVRYR